jgi:hypothetical protein
MITRRGLLEAAGGAMAGTGSLPALAGATAGRADTGFWLSPLLPAGTRAEAALETLANKKPLIRLTGRPPNYEAPLSYLRTVITPNDEFFVRYHLAGIPQVDASTWKLAIGGEGANSGVTIGHDELKKTACLRNYRRLSMRGQLPRPISTAYRRGSMGLWRDGLRTLERRPSQRSPGHEWAQKGRGRSGVRWRRGTYPRQDAGFFEEHSRVESARGDDARRL